MPLDDGHLTPARTAREAADRLVDLGHHVHYVSSGQTHCISQHCTKEK
ncbi:hypothetical protein AB0F46_29405 [Streptomyces sp. NPDC026665]